ncbi:hypothetical protein E2562_007591 [Oryza meyeriana var. granulata]|uniref:KIB1-4 beta-propeller domain-containing protein n=1 Tax=Oryza meyeriana var. granulata TaxID=110450 RepID=A0A6G1DXW3_9ORYZ|nr:hypothetical protein E2562_007591 [Oryza meyeriana var. granulata]
MLMYSISEAVAGKDTVCYSTLQGWLFMCNIVSSATCLWQPVTGDTVPLPPIPDDYFIPSDGRCLLTHSSSSHPYCAVVLVDTDDPVLPRQRRRPEVGAPLLRHIGDYSLPEEFRTASTRTKNTIPAIAAVGGKLRFIFCESNEYKMCTIHLDFSPDRPPIAKFDELDEVDAKVTFPEGMQSGAVWLLESDDKLFQVRVDRKIGAVAVYRMDLSDELPAWCAVRETSETGFSSRPMGSSQPRAAPARAT